MICFRSFYRAGRADARPPGETGLTTARARSAGARAMGTGDSGAPEGVGDQPRSPAPGDPVRPEGQR